MRKLLLLIIFFSTQWAGSFNLYDSIAFTVNGRPVTFSDVKAYYYIEKGKLLKREQQKEFYRHVIELETLYEIASGYSVLQLNDSEFRTAVLLFENFYNISLTDNDTLLKMELSRSMVLDVLKRYLMVNNFLSSHIKSEEKLEDSDIISNVINDSGVKYEVVNYLF